jgi:integrase
MAGIRRRKDKHGKPRPYFEAWFIDWRGKQKFFKGTTNSKETLAMARRLEEEHRQIRMGYRPAPKKSDELHLFRDVADEYLAWGESQGGRGGRPWGRTHARTRRRFLAFWEDRLGLEAIQDLQGVLPRVEKVLRELQASGKTGKTIQTYADGLAAFCDWCKSRGYLDHNPLEGLARFDTTPRSTRRAMNRAEIKRLLEVCTPQKRLLYEVAICAGLRAGELRALRVAHLDAKQGGLELEAAWTKNRENGFQPLPSWLVAKLAEHAKGKAPADSLLYVPSHPARELDKDLKVASIPKFTSEGKIDFHAFRVAYVSLVLEAGATVKEAQTLARHSTPDLTMNTYGRTRQERLHEMAEAVGGVINPQRVYDHGMAQQEKGSGDSDAKSFDDNNLTSLGGKHSAIPSATDYQGEQRTCLKSGVRG